MTDAQLDIVEPELPIVDCHHHLWKLPHQTYLIDEYAADLNSGHEVRATVFVECHAMLRRTGPEALKPLGEAEFVAGIGAMSDSGIWGETRMCAGFIGTADLTLGAAVDEVLDGLAVASAGRLRGLRVNGAWDTDPSINTKHRAYAPEGMLLDSAFRAGFARLAERGLVYDAWQYYAQLDDLCSLADAFPSACIVMDHCGGLVGIGQYAQPGNFERWKAKVTEVALRPNVLVKLGGLSGNRTGFGLVGRAVPASDQELAALWRPYVRTCIDLFGPERCMFESNFPVDRVAGTYRTVWNALKLTVADFSQADKRAMFCDNAMRVYRLD